MIRFQQHDSAPAETMVLSPVYKSLAFSFIVCLSVSITLFAGLLWRSMKKRSKNSQTIIPVTPEDTYIMSDSKEKSTQATSTASLPEVKLMPDNPLAGNYFPVTSGQLAALANRNTATTDPASNEEEKSDEVEVSSEMQMLESRMAAYIQYFEERGPGETWHRRIVSHDKNRQSGT